MNLFLRLLAVAIKTLFGPKLGLTDTSKLHFRVWLNDLDTNFHMNNGRYLTIMDLGRFHLMTKSGIFKKAVLQKHWMPVVADVSVRFRRSLEPFQGYQLTTRILGWDEKWFYIEQRFEIPDAGGNMSSATIALVKATFRTKQGTVPTQEVVALCEDRKSVV